MRKTLVGPIAGMALLLACGGARAGDTIAWERSLDAALAKAKAANKLVMADFYTDW